MSTTSAERVVHIPYQDRHTYVEQFSSLYRTLYVPFQVRNVTIMERRTTSSERTVKVD